MTECRNVPSDHAFAHDGTTVISHDDLVLACDRWLESKRVVLWAHRTIDRTDDRYDAAHWLAKEVDGVLGEIAKMEARRG